MTIDELYKKMHDIYYANKGMITGLEEHMQTSKHEMEKHWFGEIWDKAKELNLKIKLCFDDMKEIRKKTN